MTMWTEMIPHEGESENDWMDRVFGEERDFWPVNMQEIAKSNLTPPAPTIFHRTDGHALLYPGLTHWLAAEPEAGKSWFALAAAHEILLEGGRVGYFDYEMTPQDVARRLLLLGTPIDALSNLIYIRPPGKMDQEILVHYGIGWQPPDPDAPQERALLEDCALIVFDACTEAMATDGFDALDNLHVAQWMKRMPLLAKRLGAAVLILDHVPKSRENRGRFAIGAQHKLAQTDVMYTLRQNSPFAPGATGSSTIQVKKDRSGGIRQYALKQSKVGTFVLNSETPSLVSAFITPPKEKAESDMITAILEIATNAEYPLTKAALTAVPGNTREKVDTVRALIEEGEIVVAPGDEGKGYPRYVRAPERTSENNIAP